jgi:hypothetical protein
VDLQIRESPTPNDAHLRSLKAGTRQAKANSSPSLEAENAKAETEAEGVTGNRQALGKRPKNVARAKATVKCMSRIETELTNISSVIPRQIVDSTPQQES